VRENRLGKSDLYVSEIGFGCMSLGTSEAQALNLLENAFDLGITFYDTADLYDNGINERFVGKAFKDKRDKVVIATKVGNRWNDDGKTWRWDASAKWIYEAVQDSLERLQTDYIDLYQLHGGTLNDPLEEIITAFENLQQDGLIRSYGISSIRPNVIREWTKRSHIASNMMQYSLLDRRPEEQSLSMIYQKGMSVIARGPLAKGLLASKPPKAYLDYSEEAITDIQAKLAELVTPERSASSLALRYALHHPAVATVIPGASNLKQLEENIKASKTPNLTETEISQLKAITEAKVYADHR